MGWEVCQNMRTARSSEDLAVRPAGYVTVPVSLLRSIGGPEFVVFLHDEERGLFAIRAAKSGEPGFRASVPKKGQRVTLQAKSLLSKIGLLGRAGRFSAVVEDGALVVDYLSPEERGRREKAKRIGAERPCANGPRCATAIGEDGSEPAILRKGYEHDTCTSCRRRAGVAA